MRAMERQKTFGKKIVERKPNSRPHVSKKMKRNVSSHPISGFGEEGCVCPSDKRLVELCTSRFRASSSVAQKSPEEIFKETRIEELAWKPSSLPSGDRMFDDRVPENTFLRFIDDDVPEGYDSAISPAKALQCLRQITLQSPKRPPCFAEENVVGCYGIAWIQSSTDCPRH